MKFLQKLANISSFDFNSKPVVGVESILTIEGMLSDPAWEVQEENIEMDIDRSVVVIRIWVKRDPNLMAAHVIKKFVKKVKITFPHSGEWKIQVNDKNLETVIE